MTKVIDGSTNGAYIATIAAKQSIVSSAAMHPIRPLAGRVEDLHLQVGAPYRAHHKPRFSIWLILQVVGAGFKPAPTSQTSLIDLQINTLRQWFPLEGRSNGKSVMNRGVVSAKSCLPLR